MKYIPLVLGLSWTVTALAADSPDAREITNPQSIVSETVENAVPIPIDDLFSTLARLPAGPGRRMESRSFSART